MVTRMCESEGGNAYCMSEPDQGCFLFCQSNRKISQLHTFHMQIKKGRSGWTALVSDLELPTKQVIGKMEIQKETKSQRQVKEQ